MNMGEDIRLEPIATSTTIPVDISELTDIYQGSCGGDLGNEKVIGIWIEEPSLLAVDLMAPQNNSVMYLEKLIVLIVIKKSHVALMLLKQPIIKCVGY